MSYHFRPLEELNVIDDFLMNAIANDPDVGEPFCRTMLSVLLQRPIGKLKIRAQRVIPALTPEHRGIRKKQIIPDITDFIRQKLIIDL